MDSSVLSTVYAGPRYERIHHAAHTSPIAPETKKTQRHDASERISAIAGGAITEPRAVPALMMPMAVDRSPTGNHSATAFVAAGNPPPSPMPSRNRLTASIPNPAASPWLA